eukprot:Nitzschia sp. Nitz4//scaffold123_size70294//14347//18474//NITZ4_005922-RA/size70294-processed-gene-0.14-mRNA-1//-1//CDS//3329534467//7514//frame0
MTVVAETLEALFERENFHSPSDLLDDDSNVEAMDDRGQLCYDLSCQIQAAVKAGRKGSSFLSLRDALGERASAIAALVGPLMKDRVELDALLPATQDDAANQEVLENNTNMLTLTMSSVQASLLYAQLLSLPGALGSGLVDLEWLTALTAVVRRFSLESCGREKLLSSALPDRNNQSPSKSPPKKRSRATFRDIHWDEDEDEGTRSPANTTRELFQTCLQLCTAICSIPEQKEFTSWSSDAREVILDGLLIALGTAAALTAVEKEQCVQVVTTASHSLQSLFGHCQGRTTLQHEISVVVLRGLLHLLQLKEVLPNGEKGKMDAHSVANQTLQGIMEHLHQAPTTRARATRASRLSEATNHSPLRPQSTPREAATTPATEKKTPGRRRRTSLEGIGDIGAMMSPALKTRRGSAVSQAPRTSSKPGPVWSVFVGMLQKLTTTQGLERASARVPTVEAILCGVAGLPLVERAHFLRYLLKLVVSKVSLHRLVASEILGKVLVQDWLSSHNDDMVLVMYNPADDTGESQPETPSAVVPSEIEQSLPKELWKALQGRLMDKLAVVRARAASSIENVVSTQKDWLNDSLIESLRKRALRDETATVRRASCLALTQGLLVNSSYRTDPNILTLSELCQDGSLMVRNAAADSLTGLLEEVVDSKDTSTLLEQVWSTSVLPLVLDGEVSSKAALSLDRVIVTPILDQTDDTASAAAWRLLAQVANASGRQGASKGARQALQTGLQQLANDDGKRIHTALLKRGLQVAQSSLEDEDSDDAELIGVWCLLEALLSQEKSIPTMMKTLKRNQAGFAFLCGSTWKQMLTRFLKEASITLPVALRAALCVISKVSQGLDLETAQTTLVDMKEEISRLSFPPEVVASAVSVVVTLSIRIDAEEARNNATTWIKSTYDICENHLVDFAQSPDSSKLEPLVRTLFTVGELVMVGFSSETDGRDAAAKEQTATDLCGLHVKPSSRLQEMVQLLLAPNLPGRYGSTDTPPTIRAHAFIVLGKLCLRDERLAKNSLNVLARELHSSLEIKHPAVQSNALLVLGDLCVRYTNMADRYLPVMASCLQAGNVDPEKALLDNSSDASAVIRKHAVLLLSSLLLQDYIKWRGLLFHRFLVACSDSNEEVAFLAEQVLSGPLYERNPKLFFNNFVEALFVLNRCTAHPIYAAAANQGDGGSGIAVSFDGIYLNGELGRIRRTQMYDFLLNRLSDEEKIGITARLVKEVLAGAGSSEGDLGRVCQVASMSDLSPNLRGAWNVISDALAILNSKSMRVGKTAGSSDDDIEDPNLPNPNKQVTIAKKRLLTKISRKQLIEIVLPVLCNLRAKLQETHSPLLKDLMMYLVGIFKTYKEEVKEFLASDPTMLQEIEFDARQLAASE